MKTITLLNNAIIFILVTSCGLSETLEKKLIGKWTMEKVYEYGKDVTARHNPITTGISDSMKMALL